MKNQPLFLWISFIGFFLAQVLLFNNVVLTPYGFFFIYIGFFLLLPVEMSVVALLFIGFFTGFFIDMFYNSLGMHASASVGLMFVRNYWIKAITPQGGFEQGTLPTVHYNGLGWFALYALPLLILHLGILFFVQAGGFQLAGYSLLKTFFSAGFTFLVIIIIQYLFFKGKVSI